MKKCLYDDCPNTEDTPNVEFHEVFDSSQDNKSLNLYICSNHLNKAVSTPPTPKIPDGRKAVTEQQARHSIQTSDTSSTKKSVGAQGRSVPTTEKPKKNRHCCAKGCDVSLLTHPDVGLFKFYPSKERFEKWCLVADLKIRETHLAFCLCARHFHSGWFVDDERRNLKASGDPIYPTGPLNEATGNYCPYPKEPPLRPPKRPSSPEVIVIGDDESADNLSKKPEDPVKPTELPQTTERGGYCAPLSNKNGSTETGKSGRSKTGDKLNTFIRCDAAGCPSSYQTDPVIKFFKMARSGSLAQVFDQWKGQLGGMKENRVRTNYFIVCEYHFPEKAFADVHFRTRLQLTKAREYNIFPFGPINPKTGDYCPVGQEELSILYHKERVAACCVKGCYSMSNLFKFPYYDDEAFDIWCKRIGVNMVRYNKEYITKILCVCELHFDPRCKSLDSNLNAYMLAYGALPTLKLPFYHEKSEIIFLNRNIVPPNSEQLARSLLVQTRPGLSGPTKRIIERDVDVEDSIPSKTTKSDVTIKPVLKLKSVEPPTQPPSGGPAVHYWAPAGFPQNVRNKPSVGPATKLRLKASEKQMSDTSRIVQGTNSSGTDSELRKPRSSAGLGRKGSSGHKKRGPKKKFEPDENRPSATIKKFIDDFVGEMSPPSYSPPSSPDTWHDPLARTRDAGVQTDCPFSPASMVSSGASKKENKKALEKLQDLSSLEVGNEVDILLEGAENKTVDRNSVFSQVSKSNALEKALMGLFNTCTAGEDNAFSGLSDPSTIPEPSVIGGYDHQYSTNSTVNIIRSAAQLCEFNSKKVLQLEKMIKQDDKEFSVLEDALVAELASVMCITGVEFIKKCFDRVLQDAISREKANEKKTEASVQVLDGNRNTAFPVSILNENKHKTCSEEIKHMSKALLAYSGKAYEALRPIAGLPQTLFVRHSMTYSDGSPGYSHQAFELLKEDNARKRKMRLCSLSVVDVPLLKDAFWDGKRSFGYEDLGFGHVGNDSIREATKAVVFFVKILTENKKLPIGYCLADNLTPQVRANLITQYISHLDGVGLRCIAVVCDYSVTTYETFVELGALSDDPDTGWFQHPIGKSVRVMCFTDIYQNVKGLTDLWAEKKIFRQNPKGESTIDWDHITEGETFLNTSSRFSFVPAMAKFLSELKTLKFRAQNDPLNSHKYNAVMLTILRDLGVKKFASTSETIRYLESLTAVTDIFSSDHPYGIADRRPLNGTNYSKLHYRLTGLSYYFSGLCFGSGTKILTTNRKMPIALLNVNLRSLKNVSKRIFYGEKYKTVEFYCKRLSLEDVSATIAKICGGAKRLVTASEFRRGFTEFVDGYSFTPSERLKYDPMDEYRVVDVPIGFKNVYVYEYAPLESVSESALEFLTGNVIETWLAKVTCMECSQLVQQGILTSRDYNLDGNLVIDIVKMIRTAETCLAHHAEIPCDLFDTWFNRFSNETLNSLTSVRGFKNCSHLFSTIWFEGLTHFSVMVRGMLRIYLQLRLNFMNREERIKIEAPRKHCMKFNLGRSWT